MMNALKQFNFIYLVMTFTVLMTACSSVGPKRLIASHEKYNDAVQMTVSREVLKNIVRARYADPLQFISVTSINASFSVTAGGNTNISGLGSASTSGLVGNSIGYSDSPNITYTPMSDAGFNKSLDSPIALQEAISHIYNWGQSQQTDVGFMIAAINDFSDRAGQYGDNYRKQAKAFVRLLNNGASIRHFREYYPRHAPIAKDKVSGLSYTLAAQNDQYFYDAGNGQLHLATKHMAIGLIVPKPYSEDALADLKTLKLAPGQKIYPIRSPEEMEPLIDNLKSNTLWFVPRSVEGMMDLASMTVQIPEEHFERKLAPLYGPAKNSGVKLPMVIKTSKVQPSSLYRIQHREYWFYIDDTDPASKQMLSTLVNAFNAIIGSKSATDASPQVVLPING